MTAATTRRLHPVAESAAAWRVDLHKKVARHRVQRQDPAVLCPASDARSARGRALAGVLTLRHIIISASVGLGGLRFIQQAVQQDLPRSRTLPCAASSRPADD